MAAEAAGKIRRDPIMYLKFTLIVAAAAMVLANSAQARDAGSGGSGGGAESDRPHIFLDTPDGPTGPGFFVEPNDGNNVGMLLPAVQSAPEEPRRPNSAVPPDPIKGAGHIQGR